MMLTAQELNKIFMWLPYRPDWLVDRLDDDTILDHYGHLISSLTNNKLFDCYYSQDGGMTNYLEFICYPPDRQEYSGKAIMICVSLCAPIAAYGQIEFKKGSDFVSHNFLKLELVGVVTENDLKNIESEILKVLQNDNLVLIDREFAGRPLPEEVDKNLKGENLNFGHQNLHGLFQYND